MHTGNRQLFLNNLAQTSDEPLLLEVSEAEGCWLTDPDGKKYLDLISGISVSSLGHRRPEIVEAVKAQSDRYFHLMVYGELVQAPQIRLAQELQKVLPSQLNSFYFVNSGSEATEGAMKLAKRFTGRTGFAAQTDAYHGSTQGALSLMSNDYYSNAFRPLLPNIIFINQNDFAAINKLPHNLAAVIIELVQAERGCEPATHEFVRALRNFCTESGALLIIDEIQTGMGRTGSMFAFEQYGIVPDILLLGKALGGGLPMGAFVASREVMMSLSQQPVLGHITTFGGNALCCAAAEQAVKITASELEQFRVAAKEQLFRKGLSNSGFSHVSGKGLLLAAHTPSEEICKKLIRFCLSKGVFTDWFLFNPSALRIAPPLCISEDEIRFACEIIQEGLNND